MYDSTENLLNCHHISLPLFSQEALVNRKTKSETLASRPSKDYFTGGNRA